MINKNGSSLIVTLLIISFASIMAKVAWSIASYAMDIAVLRAEEQRMFYCAQGILTQGIHLAQNNFERLLNEGKLVSMAGRSSKYKTFLELQTNKSEVNVTATISDLNNRKKNSFVFCFKKTGTR